MTISGVFWVDLCYQFPQQQAVIAAVVISTLMEIPQLIKEKLENSIFSGLRLDIVDRSTQHSKRY